MRCKTKIENLERDAAGLSCRRIDPQERLLIELVKQNAVDTPTEYQRWVTLGRYAALHCLVTGEGAPAELWRSLLGFEAKIAEFEALQRYTPLAAERWLIAVDLFDAERIAELDQWREDRTPRNCRWTEYVDLCRGIFGSDADVAGRLGHPERPGRIEITIGGELLASEPDFPEAFSAACRAFNRLRVAQVA